jgi:hypothetical protein
MSGQESFRREPSAWPIAIVEASPEPRAVH